MLLQLALALAPFVQDPAALEPRQPLPKEAVRAPALASAALAPDRAQRLIVKFVDPARARFTPGGGLESRAGHDLGAVRRLAREEGLRFAPLVRLEESQLAALEARAAARSGRAQPDLAGMAIVEARAADADLERIGGRLLALAAVEFAYVQALGVPPPEDLPPTTPDLSGFQTYRGPDPGMDVDYAWSQGARGAGVRLSDCEYGWDPEHEDLRDIDLHLEPGQTIDPSVFAIGWDDHGTAVLGETSSVPNAYGTSGVAPDAAVYTFPEWTVEEGFRRVSAITSAIAGSAAGDVVLLEMQTVGAGGGYGPAELDPAVWTVVKAGTDAGVVVVGAAGNGAQDLDAPAYAEYRARGDSGAILVGAGSPDTSHARLAFSTYGARIDVQGWGSSVFTLGYGSFAQYGGDERQTYTATFNGTSSASPFVAAACAALEGLARAAGAPLSPVGLRAHLVATGIPQGGTTPGHIGPLVDLRAAIDALGLCPPPEGYCASTPSSSGAPALISALGSTSVAANDLSLACSAAAPSQNGLFFYGPDATEIPFGDGFLCVAAGASGIFRLNPPVATDASGAVVRATDYTLPPMSSGAGRIDVGSTWRFQFWFRDPAAGGAGHNLSNGLALTFCP